MSTPERIIRVIFVLSMTGIVAAIIYGHGGESSTFSNWIIAIANIIMAIAALLAWRTARKYLSEFFAKEGYALAVDLVNNNLLELGMDNKLLTATDVMCNAYKDIHDVPYNSVKLSKLKARINNLDTVRKSNHNWLAQSEKLSKQMLSYGIDSVEHRRPHLIEMLVSLQSCLRTVDALQSYIVQDYQVCEERIRTGRNLSQHHQASNICEIDPLFVELSADWNRMTQSYNGFFKGKRHIRRLFAVSDAGQDD